MGKSANKYGSAVPEWSMSKKTTQPQGTTMNDKSELIDELLVKVAHGKINSKEAKATLQKAFREVEIEGRMDEVEQIVAGKTITLTDIYGDDWRNNYGYQETQVRDAARYLQTRWINRAKSRLAKLTKIKEDTSRE